MVSSCKIGVHPFIDDCDWLYREPENPRVEIDVADMHPLYFGIDRQDSTDG